MKVFIGPYPPNRSKRRRRISVRIDPYDVWSLDHTLSYIILPALRRIKKDKHGSPGNLFDYSHHKTMEWGSPEFKRAEKKSSREGHAKWAKMLDEMIWAFDQIARDSPDEPDITKNKPAYMAYHDRIVAGTKMFGEWYQALWT